MDVETFNAAKVEIEQAYRTHMTTRAERDQELKELRRERQDDRDRLLEPIKQVEPEQVEPLTAKLHRIYKAHKMKLYRSRRRQLLFTGERKRKNRLNRR